MFELMMLRQEEKGMAGEIQASEELVALLRSAVKSHDPCQA